MHAYRKFIADEMDKRGWTASDLQRASGLSKQHISRLLKDDRVHLQQRPDQTTVDGLARAFGVDPIVVLSHVAEAMGLPTSRVQVPDPAALTDDELLRILAERLRRGSHDGHESTTKRDTPTRGSGVEDPAVEDGVRPDHGQGEHDDLPEDEQGDGGVARARRLRSRRVSTNDDAGVRQ